jgi:DNA polymerase III subunit delta
VAATSGRGAGRAGASGSAGRVGAGAGKRAAAPVRAVAPEDLQPGPVVLVVGGEELLAERAVATVVRRAREADPELSVETLDVAGYEAGRLELLTSPSLFGGGKVLLAVGVEAATDPLVADLTQYLDSPAPDVCVVLRHSGGQRGKALLDAVRRAGAPEVACLPITKDEEKVDFAANEFRRLGRRVSPQAVRALVDAVGSDLRELAAACAQLAEDADVSGQGRIEAETVELWFGGRVEVTGFRVADAAVAGRADQALSLLRHALATGADPVPLVAALAMKLRAMAKVSAVGRGRSADQAAALGMAPWQVDRARRELSGWTERGMADAIVAVAEADTAVKGGGRDPVYAVERAVVTIARSRGV